jgi:hypothetical protein
MLEVDLYYRFSCPCGIATLITVSYLLYQALLQRLVLNCLIIKLPTFYKSREFIAIPIKSCNGTHQEPQYFALAMTVPLNILLLLFSTYALQPYAYCAIGVRRSNFRHQASPCMSPRESTQRRKVELWARNVREFCLNADLNFTCRKATTWDRRLYFPSEGRRAEGFFTLKIRRLRPGANSRAWVPKASTLPLEH